MSNVTQFPGPDPSDIWLTKKQIADRLGRSPRWVEQQVGKGLPSEIRRKGREKRMFPLGDALSWVEAHHPGLVQKSAPMKTGQRRGRPRKPPPTVKPPRVPNQSAPTSVAEALERAETALRDLRLAVENSTTPPAA